MITAYKGSAGSVAPVAQWVEGCWVNVTAPTPDELDQLRLQLNIPQDFLTHALDMGERARIDKEGGASLIILRLPHHENPLADVPYSTVPIGIILIGGLVVTVCPVNSHVVRPLATGQVRELSTAKTNRFILHLLRATAERYLHYVGEINRTTDRIEDRLQRSMRNQEVLELLKYQKSLTYFSTGLKSNLLMLERLRQSNLFEKYPEDLELLADVVTEMQQAIEMTDISANILSQMMDAFASIISNNLNVVMKFLASMTIVLTLPSLVAGIYGMNIGLPLQNHPQAFPILMGLSLAISIVVAIVFWKKDWF